MRRAAVIAALAVLAVAVVAADAQTPGFRFGAAAGEVTADSALLWTRAAKPGPVTLVVDGPRRSSRRAYQMDARAANDLTVTFVVRGLKPATSYTYYLFQVGVGLPVGRFTTAPAPTANATIRFAISGDADATPGPNGQPAYNRFEVYGRMAAEQNHFNINLGDTIYSDSEVGGTPVARTTAQKWAKYRLGLALPALRKLRASAGLYSHWDDHEFVNDFSRPEHGEAIYRAGGKAFRDYSPVRHTRNLGLYRSVRWGKNLELFFLDERSFRSAKARQACDADLAPTAPQAVRDAFASLAPSLRNPVSARCLAALNDPRRTMLGARQYAAFTRAIRRSTATWKVVVNEVPMQQYYVLPYDRWEGYAAERTRLLRFLQANVRNVVFLTTDTHANLVNEIPHRTLGAVEGTGIWEVVAGPVATNTFEKEIDDFLAAPGSADAVYAFFFKPQPPAGLGMRCAALDTYGYAQVAVTARTFTVALKDAAGRPVREATGTACVPLVLRAR